MPASSIASAAPSRTLVAGAERPRDPLDPPVDELSDDDLEQVVGGLARVWSERSLARLVRG